MSSELGIPFCARWHALRRRGIRENKPPPFVCTGASECRGAHSHACHSSARDFPESRAYSRGPLGVVNLGFHFGRVGMSYGDMACVRTSLPPLFAQVPQSTGVLIIIIIKFLYCLELASLQFEILQKNKTKQKGLFAILWTLKIAIWSFM